jgi:hypothetical protein
MLMALARSIGYLLRLSSAKDKDPVNKDQAKIELHLLTLQICTHCYDDKARKGNCLWQSR